MADLTRAIDALFAALEAAGEFVDEEHLAPVAERADSVRKRHGFLGDTVVVALAGGTGSGKSSLLNALAGEPVSPVGPVRPTTAEPLAWIPANPEPGVIRLLDELGVGRRTGHQADLPVAIIDLPDYDSVEFEHRATVEALLPRVDAVIWVLDPQKYSDRALHRGYLVPLAAYQDQFLFVLNQVDRLDDAGLDAVLADLRQRLAAEGFSTPRIVTTAAHPPGGVPEGVDELTDVIRDRFRAKQTALAKLRQDLDAAGRRLAEVSGIAGAPDLDVARRLADALDGAGGDLADLVAGPALAGGAERVGWRMAISRAAGPVGRLGALFRRSRAGRALGSLPDEPAIGEWWAQPGLERVLTGLSGAITDLSRQLGGSLGRKVREDFSPGRLEAEIRGSVEGARDRVGDFGQPGTRWWWKVAGILQTALFIALIAGIVWLWVDGLDRGEVPWPLVIVATAVICGLAISRAAGASGRRLGRRRARTYRADIEQAIVEQLQARVGDRLAAAVAARDRLGDALSALEARIA